MKFEQPHLWRALLVFWLVLAGALGVNLAVEYRQTATTGEEQLVRQARLLDAQLARHVRAAAAALDALRGELPLLKRADSSGKQFALHMQAVARTVVGARTLIILDAAGRAIYSNRPELVGRDFSARQYFEAARAANQANLLHVSPPFKTVLGVEAFNVTYAMQDAGGAFAGVITATLEPDFHQSILEAARYAPGVWAALAHGNGRLIAVSPPDPKAFGSDLGVPGSMFTRHSESGATESVIDGVPKHTGMPSVLVQRTVKVADLHLDKDLRIGVGRERASLLGAWYEKLLAQVAVLALLCIASALGLYIMLQRASAAEKLAAMRRDEQDRSHAELLAARTLLQQTLDAIPIAVFVKNIDSKLLFVNHTAELLWGKSAEQLLGTDTRDVTPADQMEVHLATDRELIANKIPKDWIRPLWNAQLRENRTVHSYKTPLLDGNGEVSLIVGAHIDVTEQVRSQERIEHSLRDKEALLREVHHRVKNNLQVFSSLLRLEGARIDHPATRSMLQDMQGRVRSMAVLHEALYRSHTFASIDLAKYLESLAVQAARNQSGTGGAAVQLKLELDSVHADIDQATPCGLLVFELLSNAYKHAFPEGRRGTITVALHPAPEAEHWVLQVRDDGVGLPADFAQRRTQSLGLQLVSDLSRQMGGTVSVGEPGSSAAVFTIQFVLRPSLQDAT